jgi:hypothetical protein
VVPNLQIEGAAVPAPRPAADDAAPAEQKPAEQKPRQSS